MVSSGEDETETVYPLGMKDFSGGFHSFKRTFYCIYADTLSVIFVGKETRKSLLVIHAFLHAFKRGLLKNSHMSTGRND